jgi:hypothetical protein
MRARTVDGEAGLALVTVILITVVLTAIGVFAVILVNRNTEKEAAFAKSVAGFYAAEAGINRGAGDARNIFLGYNVPTGSDCNPQTMTLNQRQVTYQLTGCGQAPGLPVLIPAGEAFEGLNAIPYVYNLRSEAQSSTGFTEAILRLRFETRLIPMFQLAAFYKDDLELTVGPPMVINGRMHTNADLYLNTESCSPGSRVLGQVTVVGELYRGRKDSLSYGNSGNVWINNPDNTPRILGRTGPGDTSCSSITTRLVPEAEAALWSGRVRVDLRDVSIPGQDELLCSPWSCPAGVSPGVFWQRADLRIVLNTTRTEKLDPDNPAAAGPALYALEVYNPDGTINSAATSNLRRFVMGDAVTVPGAITYSDLPASPDCSTAGCEATYGSAGAYAMPFACHGPREPITAANFCNDFRYGGFFNWRERKPILMLNIDWMKLEEWNQRQPAGQRLFDPNDTTDGGLVIYATVRGPNSRAANNYGVRFYNAQRLRRGGNDRGATFVTDQAAYVMGSFNCRAPSVTSDAVPAGCGANGKKPAAVIGDTLNVLSCDWIDPARNGACRVSPSMSSDGDQAGTAAYRPLDERSTTPRSSRPQASETFINAAFLAGNDTTICPGNPGGRDCGRDYYSGGLENYPRFHETWPAAARFWYEGSFVAIDTPKHTCFTFNAGLTGTDDPFVSCRAHQLNGRFLQGYWQMQATYGYSPPPRRWFYDVAFNDAANLPPLTPRFLVLRQTFFTEEFR